MSDLEECPEVQNVYVVVVGKTGVRFQVIWGGNCLSSTCATPPSDLEPSCNIFGMLGIKEKWHVIIPMRLSSYTYL